MTGSCSSCSQVDATESCLRGDSGCSVNSNPCFDAVLDINRAGREGFGELLSHVRVFDGLGERGKHLSGELRARVDRAAARVLAELIADVVVEVRAPRVVTGGLDSHMPLHFAHRFLKGVLLG